MWESTTSAPVNQDSPLAPVVNAMEIDDTGVNRKQTLFTGGHVSERAPNAEALNVIAAATELDATERALRQANVTVKELYRAASQLGVFVRARKAKLVDGRYAVSFWRASQASTRGRKAGENGEAESGASENGEE
jgi:hypothetical protein